MAPERQAPTPKRLELPVVIFGPVEIRRLRRELEALEEFLEQSELREPGKQAALPRASRMLETLAGNNGLNLLMATDRTHTKQFLQQIEEQAPVIHMSLATDPSAAFTAKIVAWLRTNIHPYALLGLGLQPTIAAGCIVRTANKSFDFSLRNRFYAQRQQLLAAIDAGAKQ